MADGGAPGRGLPGELRGPKVPVGERVDWPVPWQPVHGTADGIGSKLSALAAEAAFEFSAQLPERGLRWMIGGLSRVAKRFDRRHVRAAREFLHLALGEMSPQETEERVLQSYRHFLRVLLETHHFLRHVPLERTHERFDVRWTDEVRRVVESGQGVVCVTCHVGNWEAALAALPWMGLDPAYGVAKPLKNRPLSISAQRDREARGVRLLPRRGAMAMAPKILRSGGAIGLVLDQRASKRPLLAPFFGRPARCDRSAGVLLKRVRVPVIPLACYLTEEPFHYRMEFFDCLMPDEVAHLEVGEIITRLNRTFERMILAHPEQYFWLHDRFRDTPETFPTEIPRPRKTPSPPGPVSSEREERAEPRDVPSS